VQALKPRWGVEVQTHLFLISALDEGTLSIPLPSRFTLEDIPSTHRTGGMVGPKTSLETLELCSESNQDSSV